MTTKITAGTDRGRKIKIRGKSGLRPTSERVRLAIFSIIGAQAVIGKRVLDLYAGTGVLSIEALSRGAKSAVLVEDNARRCTEIRRLMLELAMDKKGQVINGKVERLLGRLDDQFDLVFLDPPYDLDPWDRVMGKLDEGELLSAEAIVVAESRYDKNASNEYGELSLVNRRRFGDTSLSLYRSRKTYG